MMTPTYLNDTRQAAAAQPSTLGRIAPVAAFLAAIAGVLYSVSFVFIKETLTNGLFLMLGGLLGSLALVAVYEVVRTTDAGLALVGLVLASWVWEGPSFTAGTTWRWEPTRSRLYRQVWPICQVRLTRVAS